MQTTTTSSRNFLDTSGSSISHIPHHQLVLHQLRDLTRCNHLYHTLRIEQEPLANRISSTWSRFTEILKREGSFTNTQEALSYLKKKLEEIHPEVYTFYQEKLENALREEATKQGITIEQFPKGASLKTLQSVSQTFSTSMSRQDFTRPLSDVAQILKRIPKDHFSSKARELQSLWEQVKSSSYTSLGEAKANIKDLLERIGLPGLTSLYVTDMELLFTDLNKIHIYADIYLQDLQSIQATIVKNQAYGPGIKASREGVMGYPKFIKWKTDASQVLTGFMKYMSREDMTYHLLYSCWLSLLSNELPPLGIKLETVKGELLDLQKGQYRYVDAEGSIQDLEASGRYSREELASLKKSVRFLATANTQTTDKLLNQSKSPTRHPANFQKEIETKPLGFFDLIEGCDLNSLFINGEYQRWPKEKQKDLFICLGRLALLDVVFGNQDRLLKLMDLDRPKLSSLEDLEKFQAGDEEGLQEDFYDTMCLSAALENLMFAENTVHPIDNTIGDGMRPMTPDQHRNYIEFLRTTFSSQDYPNLLATHIFSAIASALLEAKDSADPENGEIFDLDSMKAQKEFYIDALRRGIEDMQQAIIKTIPIWEGMRDRRESLLQILHPEETRTDSEARIANQTSSTRLSQEEQSFDTQILERLQAFIEGIGQLSSTKSNNNLL